MSLRIAPSLLTADFNILKEEVDNVTNAGADLLHLDIMDGHFVPNLTFGIPIVAAIAKTSKIPLDTHLMVMNPEVYIEPFAEMGVKYFSFHYEVALHHHRVIQKIKQHNMKAGIALNPGTPVSLIIDLMHYIDFVLVMSVNPGYGGQQFIDSCLTKVALLHQLRIDHELDFEIEIDGGIKQEYIKSVQKAGVDIVVVGSYIFGSDNYTTAIESLKNL